MTNCPKCGSTNVNHVYDGWNCLHAQLIAAESRVAELERDVREIKHECFAPVEPKDWPDAEGWWSRRGVVVRAIVEYHTQGDLVRIMLPGDSACRYPNSDGMHGDWLPATLLVPPAAAKPKQTQADYKLAWDGIRKALIDGAKFNDPNNPMEVAYRKVVEAMDRYIPPLPMEDGQ